MLLFEYSSFTFDFFSLGWVFEGCWASSATVNYIIILYILYSLLTLVYGCKIRVESFSIVNLYEDCSHVVHSLGTFLVFRNLIIK